MQNYDAIIVGGGIAGLFTLARLIDNGYQTLLLEQNTLGAKQTLASQGIIHGGTKYSLLGKKTNAQKQISAMPRYWRDCLAGQGEVDLTQASVLCDNQLMWARRDISSKITGFFASRAMQSKVIKVSQANLAKTLQHNDITGQFYQLDEPVLAIQSVLDCFRNQYGEHIVEQTTLNNINKTDKGYTVNLVRKSEIETVETSLVVLCAGEANQTLAKQFAVNVKQQLRPLRMVKVKVPKAYDNLFLHVLEMSDKPRITISTSSDKLDGFYHWYLGGNLAEKGVHQSDEILINTAKSELLALFPWLDFFSLDYQIIDINRAEGVADGSRPDTPVIVREDRVMIAWPTKLAMAPVLANQVLQMIKES